MNVTKIITDLGGSPGLALALKIPRTTVDSWRRKKKIPAWRIEAVEALLAKHRAGSKRKARKA